MYSTLSTLNTTTEVPLSKAPIPQLLPGRRSINGCPLLRVCVHCCVCALWMGKCRARIPSMGHHTWLYVTSLFTSLKQCFLQKYKVHSYYEEQIFPTRIVIPNGKQLINHTELRIQISRKFCVRGRKYSLYKNHYAYGSVCVRECVCFCDIWGHTFV